MSGEYITVFITVKECSKGLESIEKLKLASKAGFGVLNKVGECTEKTPAHKPVWEQVILKLV